MNKLNVPTHDNEQQIHPMDNITDTNFCDLDILG